MAKFYPRPSKEKLAKKKNLFVKVPDNQQVQLPSEFEMGSQVTSMASSLNRSHSYAAGNFTKFGDK
jgi:hypothetical protein